MPSCHSTNDICAELADDGEPDEGIVVLTEHQTQGRGQGTNKWEAVPGENLTLSYLLDTRFLRINQQFFLNMIVSLAVCETVSSFLDTKTQIKWPNDIFYTQKIAGILIQNSLKGGKIEYSVAGVGLNVNQDHFHADATSLRKVTGKWYALQDVFERLSEALEREFINLWDGAHANIKQRYMQRLRWLNETHTFQSYGRRFRGTITDILPQGNLIIQTDTGQQSFAFQEVSFID